MISSVNQSNDVGNKTWGMLISHCQTFTHKERDETSTHETFSAKRFWHKFTHRFVCVWVFTCEIKGRRLIQFIFRKWNIFFLVVCGFKTKWIHQYVKIISIKCVVGTTQLKYTAQHHETICMCLASNTAIQTIHTWFVTYMLYNKTICWANNISHDFTAKSDISKWINDIKLN